MKNILLFYLLFIFLFSFSQTKKNGKDDITQLELKVNFSRGLSKIENLNTLAELYLSVNNNKSISLVQTTFEYAKDRAIKIDPIIEANLYSTLGTAYHNLKDYKNAAKYFQKEYLLIEELKMEEEVFLSLFNLGTIYKKLEYNNKSIKYYLKSLTLAEKSKKEDIILQNYQALYEVYDEMKDSENSLLYYKLYNKLKDSLLITVARQEITILKSQYKKAITEKKIKEKELAYKKKLLYKAEKKEVILLQDSVAKQQKIEKLNEANWEKELQIKESEVTIKEQQLKVKHQKFLILFLSIIFIIIFIFSILLWIQVKQKKITLKQLANDKKIIEKKSIELKTNGLEIERQNKELLDLNATKDRLFSIIAHDLKNPFHQILGLSELLNLNYQSYDKEKITLFLEEIHNASIRVYKLLENLLEWSFSQSGKFIFQPESINLKSFVDTKLNELELLSKQKNITVSNQIPDHINAFVDVNMMRIVFRNLITNAIKFTQPDGNVTINCKLNELNFIEIIIKDTGIGIKSEDIEKLFKIDSNFTTDGTAHEKGTGLGLILSKDFIEKHGGKIWVESIYGEGSSFIFTIPQ